MTDHPNHSDGHPRLITDGGHEPVTKTQTATAETVVTRETNDGDEQDMLRVPISSTRSDRENDEFNKGALDKMADQIRSQNPMVFDNHGLAGGWMDAIPYDSRETIGAQMDAEVEASDDGDHDLYALVNPDGTHPEGERMIKQVRDEGQPIKFSVGFRVTGYDEKEDDSGNVIGRVFTDADLMETSRVGIPANPDASVTQSMTAKGGGGGLPGYANHPVVQMMQAMSEGGEPAGEGMVSKDAATDGGTEPDETDSGESGADPLTDEEIRALRDLAQSVKEDDEDDEDDDDDEDDEDDDKGSCEVDTDCPEGEVCIEGECVPEDDVDDDDDEESSSGLPEDVKERIEEDRELQEEVADLLDGGLTRGDSETGDTDMSTTPSPDEEEAADADESKDDDAGNGLLF